MRLLAGVEPPDAGRRVEGHQVVMQYFAQDEATRLDPAAHRLRDAVGRLADAHGAGDPQHPRRLPLRRRRRLQEGGRAVGRRAHAAGGGPACCCGPSNTLVLDEPTNHLDLDSKDVLLDALEDYGGTLLFVSHDRYFVERLATKMVEVGQRPGRALPGHLRRVPVAQGAGRRPRRRRRRPPRRRRPRRPVRPQPAPRRRHARCDKAAEHEARQARRRRAEEAGARLPGAGGPASPTSRARIAEREAAVKAAEAAMARAGFYDDRERRQGRRSIGTRR